MIKAFLEFYDHVERREHSVHSTDTIADHVWAAPSVCGYGNQPDSAMTGTDVVGYDPVSYTHLTLPPTPYV